MSKLIIANWKMNPSSLEEAISLAKDSDTGGLVIAPPFPYFLPVSKEIRAAVLGAQDVFWAEEGAFTGEVSAPELHDIGIRYVIVGHSERRAKFGETDELIAKKLAAVIKNNMKPILCVGETREEHEAGKTEEVLRRQVTTALSGVEKKDATILIAYEPVWAISTNEGAVPDTPENAAAMLLFIKGLTKEHGLTDVQYIYGGSVSSENARIFLEQPNIEGALVGGASLKPQEILSIVEIAKNV